MAFDQSQDYAKDISDLIMKGAAAGSQDAQTAIVELHKRSKKDPRVAGFMQDAASRIREGRVAPEDVPSEDIISRLAILLDPEKYEEAKKKTPTPREEKLLHIIKTQHAKLQSDVG